VVHFIPSNDGSRLLLFTQENEECILTVIDTSTFETLQRFAVSTHLANSVSMYVSMLDSGAEVIEYLYDLKDKSPNSVFSAAVQTVINTISNDWVGVVEKTIIDVGFVLGMEATDKLIDYAWTGCCAVFPFLTGVYIGGEIGALACNILFGTEDLIEQCKNFVKAYVEYTANKNGLWAVQQYIVPDCALYRAITDSSVGLKWGQGVHAKIKTLDIRNFTYYGNVITCEASYSMTRDDGDRSETMQILLVKTVLGWRVIHREIT